MLTVARNTHGNKDSQTSTACASRMAGDGSETRVVGMARDGREPGETKPAQFTEVAERTRAVDAIRAIGEIGAAGGDPMTREAGEPRSQPEGEATVKNWIGADADRAKEAAEGSNQRAWAGGLARVTSQLARARARSEQRLPHENAEQGRVLAITRHSLAMATEEMEQLERP